MAGSPQYKVYSAQGVYMGAVKEPEAAVALVGFYGPGATVRIGHAKKHTVWTEGADARLDCPTPRSQTADAAATIVTRGCEL